MASAGLLCIGDAAHAMSPAGGVGINLAHVADDRHKLDRCFSAVRVRLG